MEAELNSIKKIARLAGLLYLIWVMTGMYGIMYVPSKTIVEGDAVATAQKILANELIFRSGILNDLISLTIGVFLLMALYQLFKQVNELQAKLMVILLMMTFPVVFIMDAFNITSLMLFKGEVLKTFEIGQRQDLAMLFLKMNEYGAITLEMFWGLWLLPFGLLVYASGFIPRVLGLFLFVNGITYIIHCLTHLLLPHYQELVFKFAMPLWILGEISIMLWLIIKGVKNNIPVHEFK
ncbi:MAG: DUF4386 domain-containing protein [Saprospiraceae bacterium]|uniref:DUF4386 domain-containing protein n=1 Tax=Candidatus Opimibacter skivensis TaxID=2982028 RepID=A0A9D7XQ16_9BACT|nr:DUF4386 domain-containing protein [Candidatus Opimibacter skivensis]